MGWISQCLSWLMLSMCGAQDKPCFEQSILFGKPTDNTGLTDQQCQPQCNSCVYGDFTPRTVTQTELDSLLDWTLLNPPEPLFVDPYQSGNVVRPLADAVCAVLVVGQADSKSYRLETFSSLDAAEKAGAKITHYGACGVCSSLDNLRVYLDHDDLTQPVKECGFQGITGGEEANMDCLRALGFGQECARIWYYNTQNTRKHCLATCLSNLDQPYHLPDGQLNECIQCDEDFSGEIFVKIAGRTRRNSGLPSALCRPCDTIAPVKHDYF